MPTLTITQWGTDEPAVTTQQAQVSDPGINLKLEYFFSQIERRALYMAELATRQRETALDLVQDAMLALVERYASRPETEWGPLFHRILQSRINDWHRRNTVRNRWHAWFGFGHSGHDEDTDDEEDPIQQVADPHAKTPEQELLLHNAGQALQQALAQLPLRQQQVFLLRVWEGLSVAETAQAMDCSEGSVKTHYSRAVHKLRDTLGAHWQ